VSFSISERIVIFKIYSFQHSSYIVLLKMVTFLRVLNWQTYLFIIVVVHKFTFSFLWAAWKAEESVSTEVNTQRLYESQESHYPMDKSKGGGIIYIILQTFFPTCMNFSSVLWIYSFSLMLLCSFFLFSFFISLCQHQYYNSSYFTLRIRITVPLYNIQETIQPFCSLVLIYPDFLSLNLKIFPCWW
jgi:hypothetical protein